MERDSGFSSRFWVFVVSSLLGALWPLDKGCVSLDLIVVAHVGLFYDLDCF